MLNSEIKQQIKESNIRMWEVAEHLGVSDMTLQRWLRSERNTSHQYEIVKAFNELMEKVKT